jgi:hypothetical protein
MICWYCGIVGISAAPESEWSYSYSIPEEETVSKSKDKGVSIPCKTSKPGIVIGHQCEEGYEVEAILSHRYGVQGHQFLVKWKGYLCSE